MNAHVHGTETPTPSIVTQIEIAWLQSSGGTPSENEATAVAAGRGVTLTSAQDCANFMNATCRSTAPAQAYYALSSANLISGQQYVPAVRITDSSYGQGSWSRGTEFTATTILDFESGSIAPYSISSGSVTVSTEAAHTGTKSAKITGVSGVSKMSRSVTFPSTGTVTFERWFNISSLANGQTNQIFGIENGTDPYVVIFIGYNSGIPALGLSLYKNNLSTRIDVVPYNNLSNNSWYKLQVAYNFSADTYTVKCFNSSGIEIGTAAVAQPTNMGQVKGSTLALFCNAEGVGSTYYVDDIDDGGL